jgi:LysR family hydrogen peroxide-inducible transcriptional activator
LGFCDRHDVHHHISFRSAQLETIQSFVHAGLGISLIPAMAAPHERNRVPEYRSLHSPKPSRQIVTVWPKDRPPGRAASEFLKTLPTSLKRSPR